MNGLCVIVCRCRLAVHEVRLCVNSSNIQMEATSSEHSSRHFKRNSSKQTADGSTQTWRIHRAFQKNWQDERTNEGVQYQSMIFEMVWCIHSLADYWNDKQR